MSTLSANNLLSAPDLILTRTFNAPRALVWRAWTDPQHIMRWWGPRGFNNSSCEMELRVGGAFHLNMCAPDGNIYPCQGIFREIAEPERIVYDSTADESHPCGAGLPPRSRVTITFAERDNKTTLTLHTRFASAECKLAAANARFVVSWEEALDRLEENLAGKNF